MWSMDIFPVIKEIRTFDSSSILYKKYTFPIFLQPLQNYMAPFIV